VTNFVWKLQIIPIDMILEKIPNNQSYTCNTSLRSLMMKTIACNTNFYHFCYYHPKVHDIQTRVLKVVDSNSMLESPHKKAPHLTREKNLVPTLLPRVDLFYPPRPVPHQILTQKDQQMIRCILQKK